MEEQATFATYEHGAWSITARETHTQVTGRQFKGSRFHYVTTVIATNGDERHAHTYAEPEALAIANMRRWLDGHLLQPARATPAEAPAPQAKPLSWTKADRPTHELSPREHVRAARAYSADKIAEGWKKPATIRPPYAHNGALYTVTGTGGPSSNVEAWELCPSAEYEAAGGTPATYQELRPTTSYEGQLVTYRKREYCLTRPLLLVLKREEEAPAPAPDTRHPTPAYDPTPTGPLAAELTPLANLRPFTMTRRVPTSAVHRVLHPRQRAIIIYDTLPRRWEGPHKPAARRYRRTTERLAA